MNVSQSWVGFSERPEYRDAQAIAHAVSEAYVAGEVDRVVIVYNAFVSALVQKVTVRDLLPIPQDLLDKAEEAEGGRDGRHARLHLRAGARGDPRPAAARCTSRRSSTARCSSRPRRSRARA